jgi:exosortase
VVGFAILFAVPLATLIRDWWQLPEASHGLLTGPLAIIIAVRVGRTKHSRSAVALGIAILAVAVALRYVAGLAAEPFTMRASMLLALAALVVFHGGLRQLGHWWLPAALLVLSIPLPTILQTTLALPLQLEASQLGATLLQWRDVPVQLSGNVIHLPGRSLFVTEACSGLRSLSALLTLGVLIGGLWLRSPVVRVILVMAAIPLAMLLNGVRVFLTGFLIYYVDPALGEGFVHVTEGWVLFAAAFLMLGAAAALLRLAERHWPARGVPA